MSQNGRNLVVDVLRIPAALGVIWFHVDAPGAHIALGGLVYFFVISFYLTAATPRQVGAVHLANRLLIPWAAFFARFGIANIVRGQSLVPMEHGLITGILHGPRIYLWFLPAAFVGLLIIDSTKTRVGKKALLVASSIGAIGSILTLPFWQPASNNFAHPWAQWVSAIVPLFAGIQLATRNVARWGNVTVVVTLGCLGYLALNSGIQLVAQTYIVGVGVAATAIFLGVRWRTSPWMVELASAMFGVYLVHPVVHFLLWGPLHANKVIFALAIFLVSSAVSLVWRCSVRLLRSRID